jgi:hypothetical protein
VFFIWKIGTEKLEQTKGVSMPFSSNHPDSFSGREEAERTKDDSCGKLTGYRHVRHTCRNCRPLFFAAFCCHITLIIKVAIFIDKKILIIKSNISL